MLDSTFRKIIDPPLNKSASFFAQIGLSGTTITLIGFAFGVLACICAATQNYDGAIGLLIMNRLCDGLDGAVARYRNEASDLGGYLDIVLDFSIYAGFPLSMAVGIHTLDAYMASAFVLFAIVTTGVSFLAYAIICAKRNMETSHQGKKSFYFSNGLMEGTETIIFMMILCVFPTYFVPACFIFGVLCLLTTCQRLITSYHVFR